MTQHLELIGRYKQLRQDGLELNHLVVNTLTKHEFDEGGRQLGILKNGVLIFNSEDESSVLMDFCLHDVWTNGVNAIGRYLATTPPLPDSDEKKFLEGKRDARYSIFIVDAVERGVGVHVQDLLYNQDVFITDIGFGSSATVGGVIAFRLMTIDGIHMTTGAALPMTTVPDEGRDEFYRVFVSQFKRILAQCNTPEQISKFNAMLISSCLSRGSSTRIRYADPDEKRRHRGPIEIPPRRAPVMAGKKKAIGREDRCPCGSGRKYKNCCLQD